MYSEDTLPSIFVFTSSLNEYDLRLTVETAYKRAKIPGRVYFGVAEQVLGMPPTNLDDFKNVKKIQIGRNQPNGLGLGRLASLMLHESQTYGLQIDAHTIFDQHWDSTLVSQLTTLEQTYKRAVISMRAKTYTYQADGTRYFWDSPTAINFAGLKIDPGSQNFGMGGREGDLGPHEPQDFHEHYLVAGGFIFARLQAFTEILPDPKIAFSGEEHTWALRASTRGWRIFATRDCPLWTLGKSSFFSDDDYKNDIDYKRTGVMPWKTMNTPTITNGTAAIDFRDNVDNRGGYLNSILCGETLGYWGAPNIVAYEKYIKNLGFDYRTGCQI